MSFQSRFPGPIFLSKSSTPTATPTKYPHQALTRTITLGSSSPRELACALQLHSLLAVRSPLIGINPIIPRETEHLATTPRCIKSPDKTASAKTSSHWSCASISTAPECRNKKALLGFCIPSAKSDEVDNFVCGFSRRHAAVPRVCCMACITRHQPISRLRYYIDSTSGSFCVA